MRGNFNFFLFIFFGGLVVSCGMKTGFENMKWEIYRPIKVGDVYVSKSDTLRILTDSTFEMSYLTNRNVFKKNCPGIQRLFHGCRLTHTGQYRYANNTLTLGYAWNDYGAFEVANYYYVNDAKLHLKKDLSNYMYRKRAERLLLQN